MAALSKLLAALTGVGAMVSAGAHATDKDLAQLSLVAGYKAAFTCSAHFNAGRSVDQIAGDELHRLLPGYDGAVFDLPDAVVDERSKRVLVTYAETMPPRISQWRPGLGCVQLPTGASDIADLPQLNIERAAPARSAPWPKGDVLSGPRLAETDAGAALKAAAMQAFDRKTYGEGAETTAVVIVKDGEIVFEHYREGFDANTPQRTWSVAKSIAATVIGAAVEEGLLSVDEPAMLDAWSTPGDPRAEIKISDLLHMSSGLDAGPAGNRTDDVYFGGGRVVDHAIDRRLIAKPGDRWYYANNDTMAVMRALRERMDDDAAFLAFPFVKLLDPLGMSDTYLETDWNGDFVMSSQVWTTARDLARLGLLYLNGGVLDGKRILPEDWAAYVAAPAPDQPKPRYDGEKRLGYGAQFWLAGAEHGAPEGTYLALGNRGQHLVIIPERNVLVVRRGFDSNRQGGGRFDGVAFAVDVLATLPE